MNYKCAFPSNVPFCEFSAHLVQSTNTGTSTFCLLFVFSCILDGSRTMQQVFSRSFPEYHKLRYSKKKLTVVSCQIFFRIFLMFKRMGLNAER